MVFYCQGFEDIIQKNRTLLLIYMMHNKSSTPYCYNYFRTNYTKMTGIIVHSDKYQLALA